MQQKLLAHLMIHFSQDKANNAAKGQVQFNITYPLAFAFSHSRKVDYLLQTAGYCDNGL